MNVRELIEKLQELTDEQKNYEVYSEGCDCAGVAGGIQIDPNEKIVIVTRGE